METEDVMLVAGNAVDNLGASEPSNVAGGGRNGILDSGPAVGSDVECKEKTIAGEEVLEASQSGDDGLGATRSAVVEGGDEKNSKDKMLAQCAAGTAEVSTDFILASLVMTLYYSLPSLSSCLFSFPSGKWPRGFNVLPCMSVRVVILHR